MDRKHKFVVAACSAAVVLLTGVSAGVYSHYKNEQQAKANQIAQVDNAQAKKEAKAKADFNYELYLLDLNCQRDTAAAQAAKKPLPICDSHLASLQ